MQSLGGGYSHDCAKAIALVASNGGNIRDYEAWIAQINRYAR